MMQRVENIPPQPVYDDRPPWVARALLAAERETRPYLGWAVLAACMGLSILPAVALHENRWLTLGPLQAGVDWAGPLAVATVWLVWGWRTPRAQRQGMLRAAASLVVGAVVISQALLGWIPGPVALWQALVTGGWYDLGLRTAREWSDAGVRVGLWWQGVQMGGAVQDNLVFAALAASILWWVGLVVAWAARRTRQGYAAGLPSLWLLGIVLIYSTGGRWLLLVGMTLTVALQLSLDHWGLQQRWARLKLDYSPGVLVDRILVVAAAMALVITVAAFMPNLYIEPLVRRYYEWIAPVNRGTEAFAERLFPDLRGTSRWRGASGGGLPNDFLLQGGVDLGSVTVLRVRTNESVAYEFPYGDGVPPTGYYMRGGTFAAYDGRGWSNALMQNRMAVRANEPWEAEIGWGRKRLVQSVLMEASSSVLYTAAEPIEVSVDASVETRGAGDLVAVYARERSYTVVSAVPAVSEEMLRALPGPTDATDVADEMTMHLALPATVTARTRELATRIFADHATPYDRAQAIETFLRQYEYDLDVPDLPRNVQDVTDYFLFDLQRGYCDYYATAFVVLARLGGLPTRFATGFGVGTWDPVDAVWIITEAEAHSWPEVFFPEVGWVPFEPTAGRPTLTRVAAPGTTTATHVPQTPPTVPEPAPGEPETSLNWQMVVWLVPLAILVWGMVRVGVWWRGRRENPWETLLAWGRRVGRPLGEGETVLEYGQGLAAFIVNRRQRHADVGRVAAREVQAVSQSVSRLAYGPEHGRGEERARLAARWRRLRGYLGLIRVR